MNCLSLEYQSQVNKWSGVNALGHSCPIILCCGKQNRKTNPLCQHMKLFFRRRWTAGSAQSSNKMARHGTLFRRRLTVGSVQSSNKLARHLKLYWKGMNRRIGPTVKHLLNVAMHVGHMLSYTQQASTWANTSLHLLQWPINKYSTIVLYNCSFQRRVQPRIVGQTWANVINKFKVMWVK